MFERCRTRRPHDCAPGGDGYIGEKLVDDEPRLSEMVELYRELGFEVHLEPLNPAEELECAGA